MPCRSELAREKLNDAAFIQEAGVIVEVFREQARSYRKQKAFCAGRNLFLNGQSVVHPFEPNETLRMLVKKAVLCLALLSAGFIAGYVAKPTPQLQVTAGQLMECGELMIPTLGM